VTSGGGDDDLEVDLTLLPRRRAGHRHSKLVRIPSSLIDNHSHSSTLLLGSVRRLEERRDPPCPSRSTALLVEPTGQDDRPLGLEPLLEQRLEGGHDPNQPALVIAGASTPDVAVDVGTAERRLLPLVDSGALDRDGI
jgi:hypothetical protein